MFGNDLKLEEKFIGYIKNFELIDLFGFANILRVKEQNTFEDFAADIVIAFSKQPRKKKKELLKLAKDVSDINKKEQKKEQK